MVDYQAIKAIQDALNKYGHDFLSEEQTKLYFVYPLLMALGYKLTDIKSEFRLNNFRIDYMVSAQADAGADSISNNVMMVECKRLGEPLELEKYWNQLNCYFEGLSHTGDAQQVHLALLTDGREYWFYTDSAQAGTLAKEPFAKVNITDLKTQEEAEQALSQFSKENILKFQTA